MTQQETAAVLAVLAAAWPRQPLPEAHARLWVESTGRVDPGDALNAARLLARTDDWFPTLAHFLDTCAAMARTRALDRSQAAIADRSADEVSPEDRAAHIAACRAALKKALAR